jgi:hypothetical protein
MKRVGGGESHIHDDASHFITAGRSGSTHIYTHTHSHSLGGHQTEAVAAAATTACTAHTQPLSVHESANAQRADMENGASELAS